MGSHAPGPYNVLFRGEATLATPATEPQTERAEWIRRLTASGLRGRGGGWFPAGRKWRAVAAGGVGALVAAHAARGGPGSGTGRVLLMTPPPPRPEGAGLA